MLKKLFIIFSTLLKNPKTILRVLHPSNTESQQEVIRKYGLKYGLPIVTLGAFDTPTPHTVYPYLFLEGGSLPTDLYLLAQLAQGSKDGVYFEIGTWRGESVLNVAPYVSEAYTLNLTEEEMRRRGASEEYISQSGMLIAASNFPHVKQLYGNSLEFDFRHWHGKCDLVFIDGDHHYRAVVSDTLKCLPLLKDENSILVWHDYGYSPEEIRWDILLAILDAIPPGSHKYLYHVAHTKCAIFTQKPLKGLLKGRPLRPEQLFRVTLQTEPIYSK